MAFRGFSSRVGMKFFFCLLPSPSCLQLEHSRSNFLSMLVLLVPCSFAAVVTRRSRLVCLATSFSHSPSLFMFMLKRSGTGFRLITHTLPTDFSILRLLSYPHAVSGDFHVIPFSPRSSSLPVFARLPVPRPPSPSHSLVFRPHSITCSTGFLRPFCPLHRYFSLAFLSSNPKTCSGEFVMKALLLFSISLLAASSFLMLRLHRDSFSFIPVNMSP